MNIQCYKQYTLRKTLDRTEADKSVGHDRGHSSRSTENSSIRSVRSRSTPRMGPSQECAIYKRKCVVWESEVARNL